MRYDNFVWREDECFTHEKRNIRYTFVTSSNYIHGVIERSRQNKQITQLAALLMSFSGSLPFMTMQFAVDTEGTIAMPWTTTILRPHANTVMFHCSCPDNTFAEVYAPNQKNPLLHCSIETSLGTIFCGSLSRHISTAINETTKGAFRAWCEEVVPRCLTEDFVIDEGLISNEPVLVSAVRHPTNANLILAHISMRDLIVLH